MSTLRYDEYEDTNVPWLGSVPKHWAIRPLWTLFRRTKRVGNEDLELLSVYRDYGVVPKASREDNFNKPSDDLSTYQLVEPSDLVINKMKAWQGSVAISDYRGIVSPAYHVYESKHCQHSKFLHYLMRSPGYITGYLSLSKGIRVNQWDLEPQHHSRMPVLLPPIEEQRSIAAFLDAETSKIDALVAEQRRLIELLKEKRQAVISHAVTKGLNPHVKMKPSGIDWLGDVPEHWKVPPVFARYSCVLGKMLDERKQSGDFGLPYLRNADVNWDRINIDGLPLIDIKPEEYDRFTLQNGDILICEGGAGIGQTAIWQGGLELCAFQKALHRLRPWKEELENPRFFYYCMSYFVHSGIALRGGTATIPHLTGEQLRKYRLPRPPKSEQDAIVEFLDLQTKRFIQLEDDAGVAISLLQERRTALISAAVTGKIDVRGFVKKGKQNAALCP